jgi:LysR family transcriptional regulator, transcriptional activator for bauABCD operon
VACARVPSADLHYEPLLIEVQQIYCSRSHPLFGQPICHPRDLVDQPMIRTGQDEPDELEHFRLRYGLGRRVGGLAETLHEVRRLIHLGIGIGFLPTIVAQAPGGPGAPDDLWPLLAVELLPSYTVYLITRTPSTLDAPVRTLLGMIAAPG